MNRYVVLALTVVSIAAGFTIWGLTTRIAFQSMAPATVSSNDSTKGTDNNESIAGEKVSIDKGQLALAGIVLAGRFTGDVRDTTSLTELRAALELRSIGGLAALNADLAKLEKSSGTSDLAIAQLYYQISTLLTYEGRLDEAVAATEKSLAIGDSSGMSPAAKANLKAVLGIIALRRGEVDNCIGCVGPSSCILPISTSAIHTKPNGSREAIRQFTEYLSQVPGDLRIRWLLNLAYMTLGEYPEKVPAKYLVPLDKCAVLPPLYQESLPILLR